ncbi:MAG: tryptophan--tRNA ligase [Candidatus Levybacteria bacterium CG10_big_fil_rev_8_21_14_0_10_36_7]|nr:MAG: tryptophan--tRNA ligase [Candidatus Levybacteria bacterium CG10_big_fil_rev_8_21_14_0_10_36_7]
MQKIIFSGIQPSGNLHIGNYIGALSQWKKLQDDNEAIFCIVDLHAITVPQDPKVLKEKIIEVAALYLACGIDPKKAHIFVQSENYNHANLAWILNTITPLGQLTRMTQFKDKTKDTNAYSESDHPETKFLNAEKISAGLFDYPVLMAADILLYQTDGVPVGEDQKQHIELTRDIAEKFNKTFKKEVFKIPEPKIIKDTARIMSLQDPTKKMSKSDDNKNGAIFLLDDENTIREKIMKAVTDSGSKVETNMPFDANSGVQNLLSIYAAFKGNDSMQHAWQENANKPYASFKNDLFEVVRERVIEIQAKYQEIRKDEKTLNEILDDGRDFAIEKSNQTMKKVIEAVGLGR